MPSCEFLDQKALFCPSLNIPCQVQLRRCGPPPLRKLMARRIIPDLGDISIFLFAQKLTGHLGSTLQSGGHRNAWCAVECSASFDTGFRLGRPSRPSSRLPSVIFRPCMQIFERCALSIPYRRKAHKSMNGRLFKIQQWEALARQAKFQPAIMAALCPISLRQLQRFFAEAFEETPGKWARALRCRIARQLVSEGWSNRAVAEELGFGNESHLCHEFRRFYGVTPQTFAPLFRAAHAVGAVPHKSAALCSSIPDHQLADAGILHSPNATPPRSVSNHVAVEQECRV